MLSRYCFIFRVRSSTLPRGRLVGRDDHARGRDPGGGKSESGERIAVGEEAAPRSKDERMDLEHELVDQVALHQRLDQLSAAHDQEILAQLLLEAGHSIPGVAFEEDGVA